MYVMHSSLRVAILMMDSMRAIPLFSLIWNVINRQLVLHKDIAAINYHSNQMSRRFLLCASWKGHRTPLSRQWVFSFTREPAVRCNPAGQIFGVATRADPCTFIHQKGRRLAAPNQNVIHINPYIFSLSATNKYPHRLEANKVVLLFSTSWMWHQTCQMCLRTPAAYATCRSRSPITGIKTSPASFQRPSSSLVSSNSMRWLIVEECNNPMTQRALSISWWVVSACAF